MTTPLPARPNLEHLRKEAKDLFKAHTSGERSACEILRGLHRFAKASDEEILNADVRLQEAQLALAVKYGFKTWGELARAVAASGGGEAGEQEKKIKEGEFGAQREKVEQLERLLGDGKPRDWDAEKLIGFFKSLNSVALEGGLIALEGISERIDDPFLKAPLELAVSGADAEIVRSVLLERKRTMLMEYERRLDMMNAGIMALVWGESPSVVESRCRAFLPERSS